jgi:transposase
MKDIPESTRERIIALRLHTSKSQREIAADVGVSQNAVSLITRAYDETGSTRTRRLGRCGRKSKLSVREKTLLVRESKKNPRLSASEVQMAAGSIGKKVSLPTVKRVLHDAGRRAYRPIRAPKLDAVKRGRRLKWAMEYKHLSMDFWQRVSE